MAHQRPQYFYRGEATIIISQTATYHVDLVQIIALARVHQELAIDRYAFLFALLQVPSPRNELVKIVLNS